MQDMIDMQLKLGDVLHEWLGIAMTVTLILHHILNRKWYKAVFKGKYSPYRIVMTAVNTLHGSSTKDLLNIIDTLTEKGVTLISHKENIDTDTPTGKFMLTVFAALSQLEREQLKQRQREGIEIAKAQGKYTGRKPIEIDWTRFGLLYGEWKSKSITGRDFMRRMGLSANTFYRRVREYEAEHGIADPTSA